MKVDFFKHSIDQQDINRLVEVLGSVFLTTGRVVGDFERSLAEYLGIENVIGMTSCTAALHLSMLALGIGEGDEVITTPMSFCATSNAVLHAGAIPVFVDVEKKTGNIDADLIEEKITGKTKAILPVHLYGHMCDMVKIRAIADKHGLRVIEDAAHCIEGKREGISPGRLADAVCFSFYATKNITSGEGGAVAVHDAGIADALRRLRLHGIDLTAAERYTKKYRHWDMPVLGWKYNMDNIQAALLIGQLDRIGTLREKRIRIYDMYTGALASQPGISTMQILPGTEHAYHLFTILVEDGLRDDILYYLQDKGIGAAVNYRPIHLLRYYRQRYGYKEGDFPVAEDIGAKTVSLPFYPSLEDDKLGYVIDTVKKYFKSRK